MLVPDDVPEDKLAKMRASAMDPLPASRIADPMELARGVLFLASDEFAFMLKSELMMDSSQTQL